MQDLINKIHNADCLEKMKEISDKSIDMILCDLPYGTTACKWDTIIPFEPLWAQYKRIIKDNGAIVLTASQPFTTLLINSNIKMFREELCWLKNKSGSGLQANQKHIKVHENIVVFSKTCTYTFNPQKWLVAEKEFLTQRKTFKTLMAGNNIYTKMIKKQTADTGERNPLSVIAARVPHNPSYTKQYSDDIDVRIHPTQKPVALFEYLIKTYTNENDLVLDNCSGSGTTAIACLGTNRKYICIEKDEIYYQKSLERVEEYNKQLKLF